MRFKSYRKYLKKVINLAKRIFITKKFNNVHGDIKKTWDLINELRCKVKKNIKASFVINRQLVEDRRKIYNYFNSFFASAARKLNVKICSSTLNFEIPNNDFKSYLHDRASW